MELVPVEKAQVAPDALAQLPAEEDDVRDDARNESLSGDADSSPEQVELPVKQEAEEEGGPPAPVEVAKKPAILIGTSFIGTGLIDSGAAAARKKLNSQGAKVSGPVFASLTTPVASLPPPESSPGARGEIAPPVPEAELSSDAGSDTGGSAALDASIEGEDLATEVALRPIGVATTEVSGARPAENFPAIDADALPDPGSTEKGGLAAESVEAVDSSGGGSATLVSGVIQEKDEAAEAPPAKEEAKETAPKEDEKKPDGDGGGEGKADGNVDPEPKDGEEEKKDDKEKKEDKPFPKGYLIVLVVCLALAVFKTTVGKV